MSYGQSSVAAWNIIAKTSAPSSVATPASSPSSPGDWTASSHHAGYTLPSVSSGGSVDPRLAAFLDEQEKREKRRKRRLKKQKREAAKIQNQPWFYPAVIGGGTLFIILFSAALRGR